MKLAGYTCTNEAKMQRVHEYFKKEKIIDPVEELVLAMYDSLGGQILKGQDVVKMGSFYDFAEGKPRQEKEKDGKIKYTKDVKLVFRFDTQVDEIAEGKAVPSEIKVKQKYLKKDKKKSKK